jgi:hypothetical protein
MKIKFYADITFGCRGQESERNGQTINQTKLKHSTELKSKADRTSLIALISNDSNPLDCLSERDPKDKQTLNESHDKSRSEELCYAKRVQESRLLSWKNLTNP